MGFNSQEGHVGVRTQASKGTYADPGAAAPNQGVFMRVRSGAIGTNRELMIPDPEIGGNRDIPDALLGPVSYSGEYDFYGRMELFATLLKGALGSAGSTGAALTGYTHAVAPANAIPWLSVEEKIAGSLMIFKYTDMKINTLHIEADADGYLMGTTGLIGLTQATTTATTTPRVDTSPLLVGSNIVVTWDSVQLPAKSFSFDINNNIEDDDFRLGSLTLGDVTPKRREVTAGITIRPEDADLWKTATWGESGATAVGGLTTKEELTITIESYEDIPGANAGVKYSMEIVIPKATLRPFNFEPSGDDIIEHSIEIQALRPDPTDDIAEIDVLNSYATVA